MSHISISAARLLLNVATISLGLGVVTGCDSNTEKNPNNAAHGVSEKVSQDTSIRIAAAANLSQVLPQIITAFNQSNPDFAKQNIEVSYASSGKLFTQITQNAPYDIFLAANQEFPTKLVQNNPGKYGQPFTYTQGQLALYSTTKALDKDAQTTIQHYFPSTNKGNIPNPVKLAIANPELAPYGKSAQSWLESQQLTSQVREHVIMGDNIEQAFTFVHTGNADFGLVAVSQLIANPTPIDSSKYVVLPASSYPAIKQDGVVLHSSAASEAFVKFLLSSPAQAILVKSGYLPLS